MYKQIRNVYKHIGDDYSKMLYSNRLLYNFTDDIQYMLENVRLTVGNDFYERLFDDKTPAVIFGAGYWGREFYRQYRTVRKIECFVDNNITGEYLNVPIVSFEQYMKQSGKTDIIISAKYAHDEIYKQLIEYGIEETRIINFGKMMYDLAQKQYFDLPQLEVGENESFVDAGCFDGMTSTGFAKWCNGKYHRIWAFEPDVRQQEICQKNMEKNGLQYEMIRKGLWNETGELRFVLEELRGSSQINPDGEDIIQVCRLDDVVSEKVTFIKMDIEGAEYNALLGARKIIERDAPKLAICIYHNPWDIWEIPALICEMNPNYKFYLRHYSLDWTETIIYAINSMD